GAKGGANAAGAGGNAGRGAAAAPNPQAACGERRSGATGPNGIYHDHTAETYVVVSVSGTLITGGTIVNGTRSAADNEVTTILHGASCNGTMVRYSSRQIKEGDVLVIQRVLVAGHAGTAGFDLRCDSLLVDRLS